MPIAQSRLETLQICKLLQCVRDGDTFQIEKMILNGIPHLINYNEPTDGDTALNIAAAANDENMIAFLLELGAHPDVVDFKGRSSLMRAAEFGHIQCLERLAKKGGDMKLTDLEGKGIIYYCLSPTQRHLKCLEIALSHRAEVNNVSNDGKPVFLIACETALQNEEMCLMMIKKAADPNSRDERTGRTALMAACNSGSVKVCRAILEAGGDVNAVDKKGLHAAHEAAKGGFFECLVILAAYSAGFDVYTKELISPLHLAAKGGHDVCCKYLGQRGCNPKTKNDDGATARALAKHAGHKGAVKECRKVEKTFGKYGKNNEPWAVRLYDWINERMEEVTAVFVKYDVDNTGLVPLEDLVDGLSGIGAPVPGTAEIKKLSALHDKSRDAMIDYNEFISGRKYINKTYLMTAFEAKKKKNKKGGKSGKKKGKTKIPMPICTQNEGQRAPDGGPPQMFIPRYQHFTDTGRFERDHAPEHPLQDDSAWYLHHPEKTYVNINDAARNGDMDSLQKAIDKGTAVDTRDKYYKTPLMVACSVGNLKVVKFLLENGANVNARDNFKWSPLHHACHAGLVDLVEYLLDCGAEMDAVAMNGGTPLNRAIESSRVAVVQLMLARGARIQSENRKGQNPLDVSNSWADFRVIECVRAKWDSLPPPPKEKKGKGGKGKGRKPSPKRASSVPPPDKKDEGGSPAKRSDGKKEVSESPQYVEPREYHRKGSILRAASALAGGVEEREDITYIPLMKSSKQPTTEELIAEKETRRNRYGYEVDFNDFKLPFIKNAMDRVEEFGGFDDD